MEKLSSGMRINRAGDDAAGLSISEKMRGQIRGLNQASTNAQDGISLIQTAEGALNETHAILQRMRELAVQSSTDTNTNEDRDEIQREVDQLSQEITRISENTEFNTQNLLNGDYKDKVFHIGANSAQKMDVEIGDMGSTELEVIRGAVEAVAAKEATVTIGTTNGVKLDGVATKGVAANGIEIEILAATGDPADANVSISGKKITVTLAGATTAATKNLGSNLATLIGSALTGTDLEGLITATGVGSAVVAPTGVATTSGGVDKVDAAAADATKGIDVSSQKSADTAIKTINTAITTVSTERSKLGAMQNRLEHTIKNLDNTSENLQAAEARIRDVDMAKEMMEQTRQNILAQASTAMLANANQAPQAVLQLLR